MRIPKCHPDKRHGAFGLCIICYNKRLRKNNPEYSRRCDENVKKYRQTKIGKEKLKFSTLKRRYGINKEQYKILKKKQKNRCALCYSLKSRLVVDHRKDTKVVRGLLCDHCNGYLGKVEKDLRILKRIRKYLKKEKQQHGC